MAWYASNEEAKGFLNKNYVGKGFLCFKNGVSEYSAFPDILREDSEVVLNHSLWPLTVE